MASQNLDQIYKKISSVVPEIEWKFHAPIIEKINKLKKEKNAVILAHNYQTPEIYHGVADISADSLALALEAAKTESKIIVLCGVHFMAETAKLMSPNKKVLIPDMQAGCSLAESITGQDVRMLKEKYPGVPVVSYVNTSAEVKAETDICCTSANAVKVVESLGTDKVIFLPDHYLANYVQKNTKVKLSPGKALVWFMKNLQVKRLRILKKITLVLKLSLIQNVLQMLLVLRTLQVRHLVWLNMLKKKQPKVLLVTECTMSDNVQVENPNVKFIKPCNLCPHMKKITLNKIYNCFKK